MNKKELSDKLDEIATAADNLATNAKELERDARSLLSLVEDIDLDTLTEDEEESDK